MAAKAPVPSVKYDDSSGVFVANCFPVRSLHHQGEDVGGAWLIAHRAEQRRRFKAVLCAKPGKTYARIKEERKKAEKQGTTIADQNLDEDEEVETEEAPVLDGFFLMKHCCVEDPADLCSVNIAGKELNEVKEEDFALFDNVAYVNAAENYLPFEAFRSFPIIRELELPLNGLRGVKLSAGDYPYLEMVDVSYNNLSHEDILALGTLSSLKVLNLSGNNFKSLPPDLALPYVDPSSNKRTTRFSNLEILMLEDNKLSDVNVFASLAGLRNLRHLNLEKNEIFYVPQLKSIEGSMVVNEDERASAKLRKSARKSARRSARKSVIKQTEKIESAQKDQTNSNLEVRPTQSDPVTAVSQVPNQLEHVQNDKEKSKYTDLLNTEFQESLGDLSARINELDLNLDFGAAKTKGEGDGSDSQAGFLPFPELRYLNLARNNIMEEEALLAVAAWPLLVELIIHDNPLTTLYSGDPPLLKRFLHDKLGIKLVRKAEPVMNKPKVEVPNKQHRKVKTRVPKIPKLSIEERLMLEGPKPPPFPKEDQSQTFRALDLQKPLPPISTPPNEGRPASTGTATRKDKAQVLDEGKPKTTSAWDEEVPVEEQPQEEDGSAFFMTQVNDQEEEEAKVIRKEKKQKEKKKQKKQVDEKYKGYEILLDYEEDDFVPPTDMQGSIMALKYALNHELVYRDPTARLDKVHKPVEPYRKWQMPPATRKTKSQKVDEVLTNLKSRTTVDEANLGDVLTDRDKARKQYPEAQKLLTQIQRRYNAVRVNSMKEARDAKKLIQDAIA